MWLQCFPENRERWLHKLQSKCYPVSLRTQSSCSVRGQDVERCYLNKHQTFQNLELCNSWKLGWELWIQQALGTSEQTTQRCKSLQRNILLGLPLQQNWCPVPDNPALQLLLLCLQSRYLKRSQNLSVLIWGISGTTMLCLNGTLRTESLMLLTMIQYGTEIGLAAEWRGSQRARCEVSSSCFRFGDEAVCHPCLTSHPCLPRSGRRHILSSHLACTPRTALRNRQAGLLFELLPMHAK